MYRTMILALVVVAVIALSAFLGYLFLPGVTKGMPLTSVNVGETYTSTSTAYLQAGIQNGYFAAHGLNVTTVRFSTVPLLVAALIRGDVQFALGTAGDVAFFDAAGGNARIIATYADHEVFSIVAPDNYTTPQSLKGKVAVVSTTAGTDYLAIALMLNGSGISPSSMSYLPGGSSIPARLALVEKGEGQVAAIVPDYLSLLKGTNLHVIANSTSFPQHVAWDNVYGLEPYLSTNRNTVDSFMIGLNETHSWFTSNKTGASEVINSYLKFGNLSRAEATWSSWQPAWSTSVEPDLAGVQNMVALFQYFNPTLGNLNTSSIVDASFYHDS